MIHLILLINLFKHLRLIIVPSYFSFHTSYNTADNEPPNNTSHDSECNTISFNSEYNTTSSNNSSFHPKCNGPSITSEHRSKKREQLSTQSTGAMACPSTASQFAILNTKVTVGPYTTAFSNTVPSTALHTYQHPHHQ